MLGEKLLNNRYLYGSKTKSMRSAKLSHINLSIDTRLNCAAPTLPL